MPQGKKNEQGFVLALTVWLIAVLALASAVVNQWTLDTVGQATRFADHVRGLQAVSQYRQSTALMLGQYPKTLSGVRNWLAPEDTASPFSQPARVEGRQILPENATEIKLDGTPYRTSFNGHAVVLRLFDARGLIQVTSLSDFGLARFLELADVPEDQQRIYVDRLRDYLDGDDFTRLLGAEAAEYSRANRSPPANQAIWFPQQVRHVLGWDDIDWIWQQDLAGPLMVTCRVSGFNPNTAIPAAISVTVPQISDAGVAALLAERNETPIRNSRELRNVTDTVSLLDPLRLNVYPSDCVVVEVIFPDHDLRYRFTVNLRRQRNEIPWEFLSTKRLSFEDADPSYKQAEDLVLPNS